MDIDETENGAETVEMFAEHVSGYYDSVLMDIHEVLRKLEKFISTEL